MKQIPFGKPIITQSEKKEVNKVLSGPILVHGRQITNFENKFSNFVKSKYSIAVSSCTAGMHMIYFSLGLSKKDEVIVPAQTHVATAHAAELTGAKVIFADSNNTNGNVDVDIIIKKITNRTKVITVVHYLGNIVDITKLKSIAKKRKIFLLEDCALSIGARKNNLHTGLFGDAGVFSFYPVKHMTTSEGGMIISNNRNLMNKLRKIRAFGIDRDYSKRKIPGFYDALSLGFNYRMSEINAAIGIQQLKKINYFLKLRKRNFFYMEKKLSNLRTFFKVIPADQKTSSYYCLSIILNNKFKNKRLKLINFLKQNGIGTSVYYPVPVPLMSYYKKKYNYKKNDFLNANKISENSIAFPIAPHISLSDIDYMYNKLNLFFKN